MAQSMLRNAAIPNYLKPMAFQKVDSLLVRSTALLIILQIRFLGGKLGEALAQEYDVSTVGSLL